MIKEGNLRGEKWPSGNGYCIWYPASEGDEDMGLCFDIMSEDIDSAIELLKKLKASEVHYVEGDD